MNYSECESVKNNVIFRDIPIHPEAKEQEPETTPQTRELVNKLFRKLDINVEGCFEAKQFNKNPKAKSTPAPINIKFWIHMVKECFSSNLLNF